MCFWGVLFLFLLAMGRADTVAIIISGAPKRFLCRQEELVSFYPMVSDSLRLANILEANGYTVYCLFCERMPQHFMETFYNIDAGKNWLQKRDGERYQSVVDAGRVWFGGTQRILNALGAIPIKNNDEVFVYMRSHGCQGGFTGPTGGDLTYAEVIKALTRNPALVGVKFLWVAECCFSGSIFKYCDALFQRLRDRGISSIVVSSTKAKCFGWSNWLLSVPARKGMVSSMTAGTFRHNFLLEIQATLVRYPEVGPIRDRSFEAVIRRILGKHLDGVRPKSKLYLCAGHAEWKDVKVWFPQGLHFPEPVGYVSVPLWIVRQHQPPVCWNSADEKPMQHRERLKYGWFFWEGSFDERLHKEALEEHERFCELIDGAIAELKIEHNLTGEIKNKITIANLDDFVKLMRKMPKFIYLQHRAFIPNYNLLMELIQASREDAIEKAFENVSKRKLLARLPEISDGRGLVEAVELHQKAASRYTGNRNMRKQFRDGQVALRQLALYRKLLKSLLREVSESNLHTDYEGGEEM